VTCHFIAISETCKIPWKCWNASNYLVLKPNHLVLQSNLFLRGQVFILTFKTCSHAHIMRLNITSLKICQHCSGAITALTSSRSCLISASEDYSICTWDISSLQIIRRFSLLKGNNQSKYVFISMIL